MWTCYTWHFIHIIVFIPQAHILGTIIISVLQMRRLRIREDKKRDQGHTVSGRASKQAQS